MLVVTPDPGGGGCCPVSEVEAAPAAGVVLGFDVASLDGAVTAGFAGFGARAAREWRDVVALVELALVERLEGGAASAGEDVGGATSVTPLGAGAAVGAAVSL